MDFTLSGEARDLAALTRDLANSGRPLWPALAEAGVLAAAALLGARALVFFIVQAAIAMLLLELFNYVAHYGLTRRRLADGSDEPLADRHSWNVSRTASNFALFNMGRHTDHHRANSRPYQTLRPVAGAPELPAGYAEAMLLALVPPLWRRVMDPRARACR